MKKLWRYVPLVLVLAAIGLAFYFELHTHLNLDMIRNNRDAMLAYVGEHAILAAILFCLVYAVAVAISIPGASFLTIMGGFLFGTWLGGALVVFAATAGAITIFAIARTTLGQALKPRIGPSLKRIQDGFQADGVSYMLILRLVPVFPFWIINLVPAFLGISLKVFAFSTFFGIMPASFVYASLGAGLGAVLDQGGTPDLNLIKEPHILIPLLGLALLALVPVLYKRWRARRDGQALP